MNATLKIGSDKLQKSGVENAVGNHNFWLKKQKGKNWEAKNKKHIYKSFLTTGTI